VNKFSSSRLSLNSNEDNEISCKNKFVSSANNTSSITCEIIDNSLIYITNKSGPNIEPCGTSQHR